MVEFEKRKMFGLNDKINSDLILETSIEIGFKEDSISMIRLILVLFPFRFKIFT